VLIVVGTPRTIKTAPAVRYQRTERFKNQRTLRKRGLSDDAAGREACANNQLGVTVPACE
jgi:hypothetical protein